MHKIKALQEKYKKGEITKAQYQEELKKLLEGDFIDQEVHDDALEYDPEADKPIFTQAEVDRMIAVKAAKMVRAELKKVGVEVDADNKALIAKVAEMAKAGVGKDGKATDADLEKLRKLEAAAGSTAEKLKNALIENAVLKAAGKYNPVNATQVVRALKLDYMDLVEIDDETSEVDAKSVDRALKKIYEAEPNLFKGEGDDGNDGQGGAGGQGGGFRGKGPGGGTGGQGNDTKYEANKKAAKDMLVAAGVIPKEAQK